MNQVTPSLWHAALGVVRYELSRTLTPVRAVLWLGLMLFPVMLIGATAYLIDERDAEKDYLFLAGLQYVLLPEVVTVLSMILWVAPIVNEELESQSWVYAVVRPNGRQAMLLGKYAVAVLWTGSCTTSAAVFSSAVAWQLGIQQAAAAGVAVLALCWISAIVHGALFLLIGTLFQRRAMVYALIYAVLVEAILGWLPAVINRFTFSFRLRSILLDWLNVDLGELINEDVPFLWEAATTKHLLVLFSVATAMLLLALSQIQRSRYRWQTEV